MPHCLSGFTASLQVTRSLFSASGLKMGGFLVVFELGKMCLRLPGPLHSVHCHKTMMCVSSPSPLCCLLQQVHWGETHVRDGTLLEFPVKWCVYICIISEVTPFSGRAFRICMICCRERASHDPRLRVVLDRRHLRLAPRPLRSHNPAERRRGWSREDRLGTSIVRWHTFAILCILMLYCAYF